MSRPVAVLVAAAALVVLVVVVCAGVGVAAGATTWDVNPGEGTPIQDAIDDAEAGDTIYVHAGTYVENLDVDKERLTLIGDGADVVTVRAADADDDVFYVTADWVNISGFTVKGATEIEKAGLYIHHADHCNIFDSVISNNHRGIRLRYSSNGRLTDNTVNSNIEYGICMYSSSDYMLCSNTISNNRYSINLYHSGNAVLINNLVSKNGQGISLSCSANSTLTNNIVHSNSYHGINLYSSGNSILTNNNASNNDDGIYLSRSINSILANNTANSNHNCGINLHYSGNSTLTNNTMSGNRWNFGVSGIDIYHYNLSHYIQNVDTSNLANEKPIYYWIDQQNKQIPSNAGFVGIVNSSNITVRDLTLTNNCEGVLLAYTSNSIVENITASKNDLSIFLPSSSNNTIVKNDVSDSHHGISISYSGDNTIKDNIVADNERSIYLSYSSNNMLVNNTASNNFHGIGMYHSSNNVIINNDASDNDVGIFLSYSSNNNLLMNNIASDNGVGIYFLVSSSNNTITNSTVANNDRGIYLSSSNNTTLHHNNLLNNTQYNAYDTSTNIWDSGSAGNYYSNYTGTDSDGDGIGDTLHPIPGGSSSDRFPLMQPWAGDTSKKGDLNGDDRITFADAAIALVIAAGGSASCDPATFAAADVSNDGKVTSLDALRILQVAASSTTPNENRNAVIETSMGTMTVELYRQRTPNTTANFIKLAESGFYDGLIFHRVIDDFVIQGGCPNGDGTGGSGKTSELEIHPDLTHVDGTIAMARSADPNSASSQFYICDGAQHMLDGQYAVFGRVIDGMGVVRAIAEVTTSSGNKPVEAVVIIKISIIGRE